MSCVHEFSLRMHTLVSNHASPASKLCSQDMRIACSARMCSHVRPACGGTLSRVSAASLRPYLIPACVRASAAGLRPYLMPASGGRLHAVQVSLKGGVPS